MDIINIKLGGKCNLHCKYCHALKDEYNFDERILPKIKELKPKLINFSGGEPLLYWEWIKKIVNYIGPIEKGYSIVTNGTLVNDEIVEFANKNVIRISLSFDGVIGCRDASIPPNYMKLSKLNRLGLALTFYKENSERFTEVISELNMLTRKFKLPRNMSGRIMPNYVHSTKFTGPQSDMEVAKRYVEYVCTMLEYDIRSYKLYNTKPFFTGTIYEKFYSIKELKGVRCCNSCGFSIYPNGNITSCSYIGEIIGNIITDDVSKIDWDKIREEHLRPQCKTCKINKVCNNFCHANITDEECYISQKIYNHFDKLVKKYNLTIEELDEIKDMVQYTRWHTGYGDPVSSNE